MKILMIAPTPFFADRGCHVRILEEAKALKLLENEVTIYTYHNGRNIPGFDIKRIINIPWYNKLEAGPSYHMFYLDPLLMLYSLKESYSNNPDIIHAHLHEGVFIGKFCSRLRFNKKPLVFDVQGSLTGEILAHGFIKEGVVSNLFFGFEKIINNMSDAIIVSSTNMAEMLANKFDVDKSKINVIPDGVDVNTFSGDKDTSSLREKLRIDPEKKIIIYTGLLNSYQGIDYLLESIPSVIDKVNNVCFLIVGFPNVEEYKNKACKLGIEGYVMFTGKVNYSEIPTYLSLADIAVSPKVPESGEANLKLFTYMASGLPTVVFDHPVNKEILGDNGVYAKIKDPHSLADCIVKLLLNEGLSNELSKKLREKAIKDYSWIRSGEKIIDVYNKII